MLKKATIKTRIILMLVLALAAAAALGALNLVSLQVSGGLMDQSAQTDEVIRGINKVRALQEHFLVTMDPVSASKMRQAVTQVNNLLADLSKAGGGAAELATAFGQYRLSLAAITTTTLGLKEKMSTQKRSIKSLVAHALEKMVNAIEEERAMAMTQGITELDPNIESLQDLGRALVELVERMQINLAGLFMFRDEATHEKEKGLLGKEMDRNVENLGVVLGAMPKDSHELAKAGKILLPIIESHRKLTGQLVDLWKRQQKQRETLAGHNQNIDNKAAAFMNKNRARLKATETGLAWAVWGVAALAVVLLLLFGWVIISSTNRVLARVIVGLSDGSDQVGTASESLLTSSNALADGSSAQAASLEETSASLEEMSSMTKRNADNARQADGLTSEAVGVVDRASKAMEELTGSMSKMQKASEETAGIIKTIDEIAFQTNLLALNAAVEAARAGEAGAGFAVVADEVRNLAMRAAEAAKNTSGLIEQSVQNIKQGVDIVGRANQAFGEVSQNAGKISELVGEIAAASNEQAQGIDQINRAMSEMDKVTQANAAGAEESAAAAQEMLNQAGQMAGHVLELNSLVGKIKDKEAEKSQKPAKSGRGLAGLLPRANKVDE